MSETSKSNKSQKSTQAILHRIHYMPLKQPHPVNKFFHFLKLFAIWPAIVYQDSHGGPCSSFDGFFYLKKSLKWQNNENITVRFKAMLYNRKLSMPIGKNYSQICLPFVLKKSANIVAQLVTNPNSNAKNMVLSPTKLLPPHRIHK